ncbi:MAG: mechanosensitive ion channel [Candidatus Nezhaarchaeales archaeon]
MRWLTLIGYEAPPPTWLSLSELTKWFSAENLWLIVRVILPFIAVYVVVKGFIIPLIDRVAVKARVGAAVTAFWKSLTLIVALAFAATISVSEFKVEGGAYYLVLIMVGVGLMVILLSARRILENALSGYVVLTQKPFKKGDIVTFNGYTGILREVGTIYTQISTEHGILHVPNLEFLRKAVVTKQPKTLTKLSVTIRIRADQDLRRAEALLKSLVSSYAELTNPPPPEVFVSGITSRYSELTITAFITNPEKSNYVASELRKMVKDELAKAGIALY